MVEEQNVSTLAELRDKLHKTTGALIGRSTVDRMLKRLNLTLKKTRHPSEKENEVTISQ
ncbi:winged helix-turn-helix domain-containing protein [Leptothoe sp. PORK10 BA2]|uniref:winged helix-turn-helix domain-containing protein n=1 Tax=Leptothoe sp. PORK10 BA2 TaxID=3110254 RepID=UPI003FA3AB99